MYYSPMTAISFGKAAEHSLTGADSFIVMRTCPSCGPNHKKIFYKRLTPLPDGFDLVYNFFHYRNNAPQEGNKWKVDFDLYSTYDDAVAGDTTKAWKCRDANGNGAEDTNDFNYNAAFYGECSPEGNRVRDQYSYWTWFPGPKPNVAYFLNAPQGAGISDLDSNTRSKTETDEDVGYPGIVGFAKESDDGIHVAGSGSDIGHNYDMFHFLSEKWSGDVDVKVHVTDFANPGNNKDAKAGVMLRSTRDPDSMHAFAMMTYGEGVKMEFRRSKGGYTYTSGTNPGVNVDDAWLRIVKKMETVEFYRSDDDGASWILQGTETLFFPEDTFYVGLAVTSKNNGQLAEAIFADYDTAQYLFPTSAPSVSSAPTRWNPDVNVGNPKGDGSFWINNDNGIEYLQGGGSQIYGDHDEFFFRNEQMSLADLSAVEMYINRFDNWYQNARGGIMVRQDDTPDSAHVFLGAGGGDLGVEFQSRSAAGERAVVHNFRYVNNINQFWVRLERNGDVFKALYKKQAGDEWIELGTTTVSFTETVQVGRAVSAGRTDQYHNRMETLNYHVVATNVVV
jgi:regulation of enolase protein 1 (concanavalin A-like superfamily)